MPPPRTPLFDCNPHPILRNHAGHEKSGFPALVSQLRAAGFIGACAVGLPDADGYEHETYFAECHGHPSLVPVAAWLDVPEEQIEGEIQKIKAIGYQALKIHPRRAGISVKDLRYLKLLRHAADANLAVFHCSYQFSTAKTIHPVDPLPYLMDRLAAVPDLRMVLLHGGTVELMRYAEALRATPNVLLDLSFTMTRYEGSSIDLDIGCLFRNFDRRLCLGSDYPDYTPLQIRDRFEYLAAGLSQERRDNIAWRNITRFLGIVPVEM